MTLEAIAVTEDELVRRVSEVCAGMSLNEVSERLGGQPFEQQSREGHDAWFWRFRVTDAELGDPYRIYMAEMREEELVTGLVLPIGSGG